jgi:hypothetical protein
MRYLGRISFVRINVIVLIITTLEIMTYVIETAWGGNTNNIFSKTQMPESSSRFPHRISNQKTNNILLFIQYCTSLTPIVRQGKNYTFGGEMTAINESDVHSLSSQSNTPNKYPLF